MLGKVDAGFFRDLAGKVEGPASTAAAAAASIAAWARVLTIGSFFFFFLARFRLSLSFPDSLEGEGWRCSEVDVSPVLARFGDRLPSSSADSDGDLDRFLM